MLLHINNFFLWYVVGCISRKLASSSPSPPTCRGCVHLIIHLARLSVVKVIFGRVGIPIGRFIAICNGFATQYTFPLCDALHFLLTPISLAGVTDFVRYPAASIYDQSHHITLPKGVKLL